MCLDMLYTKMCSFGYMEVWIECYMRIKLIKLVKAKVSYVSDYVIELWDHMNCVILYVIT